MKPKLILYIFLGTILGRESLIYGHPDMYTSHSSKFLFVDA